MFHVSIITVTYNAVSLLAETINSVIRQSCDNYEYIIVDGGSTDGTVEIVHAFGAAITTFISEKDNGIYDAMNKGIKLAEGDYCIFLNAGDQLYDATVLEKAIDIIDETQADVYFGDAIYLKKGRKGTYFSPQLENLPFSFCHQAMFFKTSLLRKNLYNDSFHFSGDSELVYRLFSMRVHIERMFFPIVNELTGEGATDRHLIESTRELYSINYLKENMHKYKIIYNKAKIALYCFMRQIKIVR